MNACTPVIRHLLHTIATALVVFGWLDEAQVSPVVVIALNIVSLIWYAMAKRKGKRDADLAMGENPDFGPRR